MHHARPIDRSREPVGKGNPQPKTRQGFDRGDSPGRLGRYLRTYDSSKIH
jgi:hypothetical protein